MTDPHPLTDRKAISLFSFERLMDPSQTFTVEDAMRTAADDQLEQVIEWLKNNLTRSIYLSPKDYYGDEINVDDLLDDLKAEMRPQEGS